MDMTKLRAPSILLDFNHPDIQTLITERSWRDLPRFDAIGAVYNFVRDEILFGYNSTDALPASQILREGYGQCNTKAILLMALLRALDVPARFHGFTIDKSLQRGVVPELIYPITPANIIHSWIEVLLDDTWVNLEGFILDAPYLARLGASFPDQKNYCGYGVGTDNLQIPPIDWIGQDTYIQSTAINQDFGVFDTPDEFFQGHAQDFPWWKAQLYSKLIRHWMNQRVRKLRRGGKATALPTSEPTTIPLEKILFAQTRARPLA
jgi:transglutaminase-like putative cysteine protease